MKSKSQLRREKVMREKKREKQRFQSILWVLLSILGSMLLALSILQQQTFAFSGKCYTRSGEYDQNCANRTRSHKVTMTYAKYGKSYYRRSRAGSNWRNHINKELTDANRASGDTRQRKSTILNRYSAKLRSVGRAERIRVGGYSTSTLSALYQRSLKRRTEHRKFMSLYE